MGRSSLLPFLISRTDACVRCWATSPIFLVSSFIGLGLRQYYDYGSRGSRLMALPNHYLVSSYKSALCAAMECHLRVSGLFLLFALPSESLSSIAPLALNSALLLLKRCTFASCPCARYAASCLGPQRPLSSVFRLWALALILSQHEVILSRQHAKRRAEGALA